MNNIEILEEFIKHYKEVQEKYKDDEIQAEIEKSCYFEEVPAKAIENLIKENKELKEKVNILNQEKEYLNCVIDSDNDNYIPKSKVKAMLEGITKEYSSILSKDIYSLNDKNIATFQYNAMRKILEELLEEGGKQ